MHHTTEIATLDANLAPGWRRQRTCRAGRREGQRSMGPTVTSSVGARAPTVLFGTALILRHRQTGYHDIRVVREAQAIGPVS